ncbi:MAG TPA: HEAT repeat domain-containing protein, partial [Planctomycetota bacterium]|nr:HEAT repeat domain-containing protein [Planctomycetota bacterium]
NELMHGPGGAAAPAPYNAPYNAPQHAAHHAPQHMTHGARARSGGSGAALAVIGWLGTAALGFWLFDRAEREREAVERRLGALARENDALAARLDGARAALEARLEDDARTQVAALAAQRAELDLALARQGEAAREAGTRLEGFDQRLATLQQSLGGVQRHDQELVALQGKYNALSAELADLGRVMGDLVDETVRVAERDAAAAAVAAQPAWTGLIDGLASPDDGDRWQAVIALGETRDPAVAPHVLPVLKDTDIFVRMAAARILGDLRNPVAVPDLIEALADPEPSVREAVYTALKAVTGQSLTFDALSENADERAKRIQAWRDWWQREGPQPVDG